MHAPLDNDTVADLLRATGERHLAALRDDLDRADPHGLVSPAARLLCCGLAALAESAARSRGVVDVAPTGRAAARLALLTKLDDEVIDAAEFHGGPDTPRREVRRRTEVFLAPTLRSVRDAHPADDSPRCRFAADLGAELQSLAIDQDRLSDLVELIADGWEIQVDAVEVLSAAPDAIEREHLANVTGAISGAWLAMVTFVGLLGAVDGPTDAEEAAFFEWGLPIQAADALADLHKDLRDDFVGTLPLSIAHGRSSAEVDAALGRRDAARLDALLVQTGADVAVLPDLEGLRQLDSALSRLGAVPRIMRWIHGFLLGRYLARVPEHPRAVDFQPYLSRWEAWRPTHDQEIACSA